MISNSENKEIKVSVIIPVYNMEKYLKECLDTVVSQTLKEIEIICINDGSNDKTEEIIKEYADKDSRVKLISQENQGVGRARNNGIRNAKGKYVAFMDPDDWYPENNTLKLLYQSAEKHNVMICGGSLLEVTDGNLKSEFKGYKQRSTFKEERMYKFRDYQYDYGFQRFIYNLEFLKNNNILFPAYTRFQDPPFFVKAMALAEEFYGVKECTYKYRVATQVIKWTDLKLFHLLCGIRDNLKLSAEMELQEIHFESIKRLHNNYLPWIEKKIEKLTDDIVDVLIEICENIRVEYADYLENYRKDIYRIARVAYQIKKLQTGDKVEKIEDRIRKVDSALFQEKEIWAPDYVKAAYEKIRMKNYDVETEVVRLAKLENTPDISVIVPVYNVEKYLEECLESIITQSFRNFEVICVNDGSTDNSMDILEKYAKKDPRISIYTHENVGLSETRNSGVRKAQGRYIYFMDSDDLLEKDALEVLYEKAGKNDLDVIYFDGTSFSDTNSCLEQVNVYKNYYTRKASYEEKVYKGAELLSLFESNQEYRTSACLQMVKKDFFEEQELWFARGILHEDNLFTFSCLLMAKRAGYVNRSLFQRRVREASIMTNDKTFYNVYGYFYGYLRMYELIEKYSSLRKNIEALNILYRQLDYAKSIFAGLDEEEQYSYMVLEEFEKNLFKLYISDSVKYRKEKVEIYEKLQTAWDEKSSINRKLQITYKEKAERGIEIKKLKKEKKDLEKIIRERDAEIARMRYNAKHPVKYICKKILYFLHIKR